MKRAATERLRTLHTWRKHVKKHADVSACTCELQPGRFRKSQRVGGCGRAQCWLCHGDKLSGAPTVQERRSRGAWSDGMVELGLRAPASSRRR